MQKAKGTINCVEDRKDYWPALKSLCEKSNLHSKRIPLLLRHFQLLRTGINEAVRKQSALGQSATDRYGFAADTKWADNSAHGLGKTPTIVQGRLHLPAGDFLWLTDLH